MPRSVSEEVLAMQGKFPAQVEGDHNKPPAGRRSRKARRKGIVNTCAFNFSFNRRHCFVALIILIFHNVFDKVLMNYQTSFTQ